MKVLWFTNVVVPEASRLLNDPISPFGGWLIESSRALSIYNEISLIIAAPKRNINQVHRVSGDKIEYVVFPWTENKISSKHIYYSVLEELIVNIDPDIIHIHGTEYTHAYFASLICQRHKIPVVVSIQGLVSVYSLHYMSNLPAKVQLRNTLRDIIRNDGLLKQQLRFSERGKTELSTIYLNRNFIGRTQWDLFCLRQANPQANYFNCNENLRSIFYTSNWEFDKCTKHTIVTSQGSYPIKGLHNLLEAVKLLVGKYPDIKLKIAGQDILLKDKKFRSIYLNSYSKYINELITSNNLENHILFTGVLDEAEMCELYLKSNVFVCPSSIENSPNSLGEAMLLGLPCIASYVGGIPDLLKHDVEGYLYQHDAPYMLSAFIDEVFSSKEKTLEFSKYARRRAQKTHDIEKNTINLVNIYRRVIETSNE